MSVTLVEDGAALLSMRNSDFDAYSAFGEVVDNSIQAAAKNVKVPNVPHRAAFAAPNAMPARHISVNAAKRRGRGFETFGRLRRKTRRPSVACQRISL